MNDDIDAILVLANNGDADAQCFIAKQHEDNEEYEQALFWYKNAAVQGYAEAQYCLGNMYYRGQGIHEDNSRALFWNRKAANKGYIDAQNRMGEIYYYGYVVKKDHKQALFWYTQAAKQGNDEAKASMLMLLYDLGEKYSSAGNYPEATHWYHKAAKLGYIHAQWRLACIYEQGLGVNVNHKQAVYWLTRAAEQGDFMAARKLADMYYYGEGIPRNYKQALDWYTQLAYQGYDEANMKLGDMHYNGMGTARDYREVYIWYYLCYITRSNKNDNTHEIECRLRLPFYLDNSQICGAKIDAMNKYRKIHNINQNAMYLVEEGSI